MLCKPPTPHVGGVKWYVVLEVFCVVYVGKPPTQHVGSVKWYVDHTMTNVCMKRIYEVINDLSAFTVLMYVHVGR